MRFFSPLLLLAALCSVPSTGAAQTAMPVARRYAANLPEQHDRGLLVGLRAGLAYTSAGITEPQGGVLPMGMLTVGFLPTSELAIGLSGWAWRSPRRGGYAAGPSLTYWVGKHVAFSGTIGVGPVAEQGHAGWALAGTLALERAWWVSDRLTLGGAIEIRSFGLDLDGDGIEPLGTMAGLAFSATFN